MKVSDIPAKVIYNKLNIYKKDFIKIVNENNLKNLENDDLFEKVKELLKDIKNLRFKKKPLYRTPSFEENLTLIIYV